MVKQSAFICGWCIDHDHNHCKRGITYYDKHWTCNCQCGKESP